MTASNVVEMREALRRAGKTIPDLPQDADSATSHHMPDDALTDAKIAAADARTDAKFARLDGSVSV